MGKIHVLPDLLVNQIAAGEVVERPASVVKECVENSLDAGASQIDIDIENAGMGLIRILDNGSGISEADLPFALCRHATSKITQAEDLFAIDSMGFRGEALASVASVSKILLKSRHQTAEQAYELSSALGQTSETRPCSHVIGTTIEIRDLFFNVPVRRKFLRSEKTEFHHIMALFKKFVLCHFPVAFSIKHNQRLIARFPAAKNQAQQLARLKKLMGMSFVRSASYIDIPYDNMRLSGWIGRLDSLKRTSECQYFYVNQRMVRDKLIQHAVKSAYQVAEAELLGQYPSYLLTLQVPPSEVDVNVHPTKHEVRFTQAALVHDFIEKCLKDVLKQPQTSEAQVADVGETAVSYNETVLPPNSIPNHRTAPTQSNFSCYASASNAQPIKQTDFIKATSVANIQQSTIETPEYGAPKRWHVIEKAQTVYLIDLKRAQDTIICAFMDTTTYQSWHKALLFPVSYPIVLPIKQQFIAYLEALGFECEVSTESLAIHQLPFGLLRDDLEKVVHALLSKPNQTVQEIKAILLPYVKSACIHRLPLDWLNAYLSHWVAHAKDGPWLTFSMEKLDNMLHNELKTQTVCPNDVDDA